MWRIENGFPTRPVDPIAINLRRVTGRDVVPREISEKSIEQINRPKDFLS
jgi:hypothetical protein